VDSGPGNWKHIGKENQEIVTNYLVGSRSPEEKEELHKPKLPIKDEKTINPSDSLQPHRITLPKDKQVQDPQLRIRIQDEVHPSGQERPPKVRKVRILQVRGQAHPLMVPPAKGVIIEEADPTIE